MTRSLNISFARVRGVARINPFLKRFAARFALARGRGFAGQLLGAGHIPQDASAVRALDRGRFARQPLEVTAQTFCQRDGARNGRRVRLGAPQCGRIVEVFTGGDGGHSS